LDTEANGDGTARDALTTSTDLAGRTIGHYCLAAQAGGGGPAVTVYRAYDQKQARQVALKCLLSGADEVTRERFGREACTVSKLEHPHIVRTIEVGQSAPDDVSYIAMELVEGESLADLLARQGRLSPHDACRVLAPVAQALGYIHALGVVHRNVKPSNILLQRADPDAAHSVTLNALPYPVVPLLSDFGIARSLDAPELTSTGRTIGTPAYMAPEQCTGRAEIDGRADIYSLGVVLYRCLVGRAPYAGSTTQILHAHVYDPLSIPEELARKLPAALVGILSRSMEKEPARRYARAELMASDIASFAAGVRRLDSAPGRRDIGDPTMTMETLPAARLPSASASRILVPSGPATERPSALEPAAWQPSQLRRLAHLWQVRGRPIWVLLICSALVLLALLQAVNLFVSAPLTARSGNSERPARASSNSGNGEAADASPELLGRRAALLPDEMQAGNLAVAAADAGTGPVDEAIVPVSETVGAPKLPPAVSVESAWRDAQAYYAERDWLRAIDWLIIMRRLDVPSKRTAVDDMLVTAYLGQATEATMEQRYADALKFIEQAQAVRPGDPELTALGETTRRYAEAEGDERSQAERELQQAYARVAAVMMALDQPCVAFWQIGMALRLHESFEALEQQVVYRHACEARRAQMALEALGGRIIYSAQQGDRSFIFQMPVGSESSPTLLLEDATQPSLARDGRMLAYHSTQPDALGLFGFDLTAGLAANDRSLRFTQFGEDARDAPPSWNTQGNRLAFTSTRFGDGRHRVYLAWADGSGEEILDYGQDPAWHPTQDRLVYSGVDVTGSQPGLWLRSLDGSTNTPLTDNGADRRPTWSPDGRYVVFMSNGRDGNWELYRVDVESRLVTRLTDSLAQDGLPTLSPDGQHVAFVSDRDGYWRIWYISINGGEARPLGVISGEMPYWLEHSLQWVK
jgi:serine/threonine protein kinase